MIGFGKAINNGFASHNEFVRGGGGVQLLKCLGIENFLTNLTIFFFFPLCLIPEKAFTKGIKDKEPCN